MKAFELSPKIPRCPKCASVMFDGVCIGKALGVHDKPKRYSLFEKGKDGRWHQIADETFSSKAKAKKFFADYLNITHYALAGSSARRRRIAEIE